MIQVDRCKHVNMIINQEMLLLMLMLAEKILEEVAAEDEPAILGDMGRRQI